MPSEQAKANKAAYDTRYKREHIKMKTIGFNVEIKEDMELYDWVGTHKNQQKYMKDLIRDDMQKTGK